MSQLLGKYSHIVMRLDKLDKKLSCAVQNLDLKWLEYFVVVWGSLFTNYDTIWIPMLLSLLIAQYHSVEYSFIMFYTIGIPLTALMWGIIKHIFKRKRPSSEDGVIRKIDLRIKQGESFSFPSGDSLQAGFFSTFFFLLYGNVFYLFVYPLVAFARVYYKCHWIGDTIFGGMIGVVFGYIYFTILPFMMSQQANDGEI